jgi:hypothetical protein
MSFDRDRLPEPIGYFEGQGLNLSKRGKWRTTECRFHNGSDSMRINASTGAWVCMSCGAKGGDVLAYQVQAHGMEFMDAAKSLGAWVEDGKPTPRQRPAPLPPRAALEVMSFESNLIAVAAGNLANGVALTDVDRYRLLTAANRIARLVEAYQ